MIQICAFKKKRKERHERKPRVGGQWKVPSLVALGMFHAWKSMGKHFA